MGYKLLASTCVDGDCPSIWVDDDAGDVILRSREDKNPAVERDIRYTAQEWDSLLRQIGR